MPVLGVRRGRSSCSSQLQPLGAALGEQGAEPNLKSFCVLGVASYGSTALIDHAAYLFTALTSWLWSLTSQGREGLYPGLHQPLMQYVGYGVPRTHLLRIRVNNGKKREVSGVAPRPSHMPL